MKFCPAFLTRTSLKLYNLLTLQLQLNNGHVSCLIVMIEAKIFSTNQVIEGSLHLRMKAETEKEVSSELYSMLGYDSQNKRVRMGMLAEKTHPYIKEKVEEMLIAEYKFKDWEARDVMEKTWKDTPENMQIKMTGNIGNIFENLKSQGVH